VRKLAEGGMGAVYEARDPEERPVAVKLLHAHLAREPQIVERFRREALAASAIGDPHIVEVRELGELEDGSLYLAMALLEGPSLAGLLDHEGALSVGRAVGIACQICEALEAAHEKGIVHRDLKPENVFLVDRGEREFVKVLDFGITKLVAAIEGVQPS